MNRGDELPVIDARLTEGYLELVPEKIARLCTLFAHSDLKRLVLVSHPLRCVDLQSPLSRHAHMLSLDHRRNSAKRA